MKAELWGLEKKMEVSATEGKWSIGSKKTRRVPCPFPNQGNIKTSSTQITSLPPVSPRVQSRLLYSLLY